MRTSKSAEFPRDISNHDTAPRWGWLKPDFVHRIQPHFVRTPGLTVIPKSSPNFTINLQLKPKLAALYRKYGLSRCPNYGLFWAGYPTWTMISGRDKMVLLVVELLPTDIVSWHRMDEEVRGIREELKLTGVTIRYYVYWDGRKKEAKEAAKEAEEIQSREEVRVEAQTTQSEQAQIERGGARLPMLSADQQQAPEQALDQQQADLVADYRRLQPSAQRLRVEIDADDQPYPEDIHTWRETLPRANNDEEDLDDLPDLIGIEESQSDVSAADRDNGQGIDSPLTARLRRFLNDNDYHMIGYSRLGPNASERARITSIALHGEPGPERTALEQLLRSSAPLSSAATFRSNYVAAASLWESFDQRGLGGDE